MKPNNIYNEWINVNYPTPESAKSKCDDAVKKMHNTFPELKITRGYVMEGLNFRPHWWLKTEDDIIVDPTAHQWKYILFYDEVPDNIEEPHGKCYNCGELLYISNLDDTYLCKSCVDLNIKL